MVLHDSSEERQTPGGKNDLDVDLLFVLDKIEDEGKEGLHGALNIEKQLAKVA